MGVFKNFGSFWKKLVSGNQKEESPARQKKTDTPAKSAKPVRSYQKKKTPAKPVQSYQKSKTPANSAQTKEKCTVLKAFQNHSSYISELEKLSRKLDASFPESSSLPVRVKELKEELNSEISNTSAGDKGEKMVYDKLCSIPKNMTLLHDFYLSGEDKESAQSDFILITSRLILVLECKHWKSEIKISYDNKNKKLICGDYDDPLTQNQNHIRLIQTYCKDSEIQKRLRSLVVFSNQNEIRIQNAQIRKQVARLDELESRIQALETESGLSPMSQKTRTQAVSWFKQNDSKNQLYQKILESCSAEYSRLLHEKPLGCCPSCKRAVYASDAENSDYCKCGRNLSKMHHAASVKYDALCPNCQKPLLLSGRKNKNTRSCSCGMLLYAVPDSLNKKNQIFLTNEQTKQLLNHSPVELHPKNENRIFKISPEVNQESHPPSWKTKELYLCPQCGQVLFRLSGLCQNCGMNLQSVHFGKIKINAFQVKQLLTGKKLEASAEGKNFIIFPHADPNNHERIKFQWHYEEKK